MKAVDYDKIHPFNWMHLPPLPALSRLALFTCCLSMMPSLVQAEDWSQCSVPVIMRENSVDNEQYASEITADRLFGQGDEFLLFDGQVEFKRNQQLIQAESLKLYQNPQRVQASGNILYSDDLFSLRSETLSLDDGRQYSLFEQTEFELYENHMRGAAKRIEQFDDDHSELHNVMFTTCDPGKNHWSLSAGKLKLNQQTSQGTAHHAVLRIGKVPVFYFPWFMFPLGDQRMSGLLSPTLSSSDNDGTTLSLPVYWNQAPNYDMTITPVWYSKRSLQLNTENRYLFEQNYGQLNLSWLDDEVTAEERWFRQWRHEANSSWGIRTSINLQRVSDTDFLEDFDHLESVSYVDFLKSSVSFSKNISGWGAQLLFEEHQTIDVDKSLSARPYKRLPRLTLNRLSNTEYGSLNLQWDNEWVRFDRENSITGDRLHVSPIISYPLEDDYFFLKPQLQLDYTRYELDNNSAGENSLERSLPLLSIDSGLIFERQAGFSNQWLQTLEPRLYLLYVPYESQQEIPDFDTALLSENYNNLFINNRFSGADRIGDSKQISFGLTTRLFDAEQGSEFFSASIGQAFYAEDRRVSLGSTIDERDKSSLMTLLNYRPKPEWELQLASVYDQQEKESVQTDLALRRHSGKEIFNLEYHFRENNLEQSTLSMVYPVSNQWTTYIKHQQSIRNDRPVQNLFGFAYESCCWSFDMLYEESSDSAFTETDRTIFFQLTFKGLASAGKDIESILEDGILGYRSYD